MSNEVSWSDHLCVDGSVEYRADALALMCDYDTWSVGASGVPALSEQSRIDVVVSSQKHPLDAWLVEVKDFRRLTRNASRPAQAGRVAHKLGRIDNTLANKLGDSLDFIASAECPPTLSKAVNTAQHKCFVFHCIMPELTPALSPMIPTGFPANQFIAFLHSSAAQRVDSSILRRDETINEDPALPWSVTLLPA